MDLVALAANMMATWASLDIDPPLILNTWRKSLKTAALSRTREKYSFLYIQCSVNNYYYLKLKCTVSLKFIRISDLLLLDIQCLKTTDCFVMTPDICLFNARTRSRYKWKLCLKVTLYLNIPIQSMQHWPHVFLTRWLSFKGQVHNYSSLY